ncbi:MAG: hypothetical protein HRU12_13650 [Phaeodactylibacter sp.]|nr:hypothetical protein [Phaeodactylibacter sp.]
MIFAALLIIVVAGATYFLGRIADAKARPDHLKLIKPIILLFGFSVILAVFTQVKAEPITIYAGYEAGIDWPHDSNLYSPQCVNNNGDRDGLTSDGRLFIGASQPWGIVTFYGEFDPWRHKSCALVEDSQVYDAYGIKFGARVEFNLPF